MKNLKKLMLPLGFVALASFASPVFADECSAKRKNLKKFENFYNTCAEIGSEYPFPGALASALIARSLLNKKADYKKSNCGDVKFIS